jgi:uncharacterized protein YgiM (DUF1202 family)
MRAICISPFTPPRRSIVTGFSPEVNSSGAFFHFSGVDNPRHANIRKGPSLRKPVVKQAAKGEIYKIFNEKGEWVKVGYYLENEVIGWIRQDLVWGE